MHGTFGSLRVPSLAAVIVAGAVLAGCEHAPARFGDPARLAGAPPSPWSLTLDAAGHPRLGVPPVTTLVPPAGACASSLVFARGGGDWYAAWWQPRPDSSAALVVSRSVDGGASWTAPVTADARDRMRVGCARPGPSIAADSSTGYVHLAYYVRAADGAGVWFCHSMEHGALFHAPVGVFFGDDPARAAVAAHGDTVVVAYEYPNAAEARVGVVISYTAGHTFGARMPVSSTTESASDPRVAMHGPLVAVAWVSRAAGARDESAAGATIAVVGTLGPDH